MEGEWTYIDSPIIEPDLLGRDGADAVENDDGLRRQLLDKLPDHFGVREDSGRGVDVSEGEDLQRGRKYEESAHATKTADGRNAKLLTLYLFSFKALVICSFVGAPPTGEGRVVTWPERTRKKEWRGR